MKRKLETRNEDAFSPKGRKPGTKCLVCMHDEGSHTQE